MCRAVRTLLNYAFLQLPPHRLRTKEIVVIFAPFGAVRSEADKVEEQRFPLRGNSLSAASLFSAGHSDECKSARESLVSLRSVCPPPFSLSLSLSVHLVSLRAPITRRNAHLPRGGGPIMVSDHSKLLSSAGQKGGRILLSLSLSLSLFSSFSQSTFSFGVPPVAEFLIRLAISRKALSGWGNDDAGLAAPFLPAHHHHHHSHHHPARRPPACISYHGDGAPPLEWKHQSSDGDCDANLREKPFLLEAFLYPLFHPPSPFFLFLSVSSLSFSLLLPSLDPRPPSCLLVFIFVAEIPDLAYSMRRLREIRFEPLLKGFLNGFSS